MSASRERKQRTDDSELLSAKEIKAKREAEQAKRKTVIYVIVGVVCVLAAAALLIWNSGFLQSRAVAVTVDGKEYTTPYADFFYHELYTQYAYTGSVSTTTPLDEQVYDEESGQTWDDFFRDYARQSLTALTVLTNGAQAEGLSLTDEEVQELEDGLDEYEVSAISSGYGSLSRYLKSAYGPYMTRAIFQDILEMQSLATKYYDAHQETLTYSDDELDAYYDENSAALDTYVHNTCFIAADADAEADEAALADATEAGDAMAAELEAGGDFAELAEQYTAGEESPTIYTGLTVPGSQLSTLYGEWLQDTARQAGDVTVMESSTSGGYFVVQFVDRYLLTSDTVDLRHILIKAETDEDADAPTAEQMAAAKEKVEQLLAAWQSGEATEDSFAALANENSEDTGSNTNGGFYNAYKGQMIPSFDSWIFDSARKSGDVGIVENDNPGSQGYHLIYYIGTNEPYWKQEATASLQETDMTEWLDGLTSAAAVTDGSGMNYVG